MPSKNPPSRKLEPTATPGIYKRGGGYVVRFRDHHGRQRQRAAPTMKAARAIRAANVADVGRGEWREQSRQRLSDYAIAWIDAYNGRTDRGVREETRTDYKRDLEDHILPRLGRLKLGEITPADVKALAKELADKDLRPATVRKIIASLRACLADAVQDGMIRANPCTGLRLPGGGQKQPGQEIRALSPEELERLLEGAIDRDGDSPPGWRRLVIRFLADTGLRIGELVALRWEHVNFADQRVLVRERLYRGRVDAPKSSYGRRDVPISNGLAQSLREHKMASRFKSDDGYVFATSEGTPHLPENLRRRVLDPARKAADIEPFGWHVLRHTAVSRWFRAGVDAKRVQILAGHHSPAFTLATYTHLLPSDLPDMAFLDGVQRG